MSFNREKPYNNLPHLPPSAALETVRTLKRAIGANKALAELKGVGELIPNQSVLIRSILLQEAKLSSEIENIVTTNDKLYKAFSDDGNGLDPNTKEVLRYGEALWHGYNSLGHRPLSTSLFFEIVNVIRQNDAGIRKHPGTRIANLRGETIYTPPEGEDNIRALLRNLELFMHGDDDLDPLIRMAATHYQFEAIHPFSDGNGRTGRIINVLYLVSRGLLNVPVLYLSRYIIENKSAYYSALRRVTEEGAWEDWIVYMLEGIERTAIATRDKIVAIRRLFDEAIAIARDKLPGIYKKELIELIFQQPYPRIHFVERAGLAKRETASNYLKELERIGLLKGYRVGRELLYVNERLYEILVV